MLSEIDPVIVRTSISAHKKNDGTTSDLRLRVYARAYREPLYCAITVSLIRSDYARIKLAPFDYMCYLATWV